jgi:hypothetical protein
VARGLRVGWDAIGVGWVWFGDGCVDGTGWVPRAPVDGASLRQRQGRGRLAYYGGTR